MGFEYDREANTWTWVPDDPQGTWGADVYDYEPQLGEQYASVTGQAMPGYTGRPRLARALARAERPLRGLYTSYLQSGMVPGGGGTMVPEGFGAYDAPDPSVTPVNPLSFANWLQQRNIVGGSTADWVGNTLGLGNFQAQVTAPQRSGVSRVDPVNWGELGGLARKMAWGEGGMEGEPYSRWATQIGLDPSRLAGGVTLDQASQNAANLAALAGYRTGGGFVNRMYQGAAARAREGYEQGYTDPSTGEWVPGQGMGSLDPNLSWLGYITDPNSPKWLRPGT